MKSINKKGTVEAASIYLVSSIISFAISFLVLPIYTRHLSPSDFGIIVLFGLFGRVVVGFVTFNLHFASYRYYFQNNQNPIEFKILFSTNILFLLIIFIISGTITYFFSSWFSAVLFDGQLTRNLIGYSLLSGCLDYLFLYMTTLLAAQVKAILFAIFSISNILLNTIFSLIFIYEYSLTYMARIYGTLLSQIIVVIFLFFSTIDSFVFKFSVNSLKKSLRLTFPLIPQMILGLVQNTFDKTMLNKAKGATTLGYYSFGVNFAVIMKTIMDSVEKAWGPFFIRKALEDTEAAKNEIIKKYYVMAFYFMLIGLCVMYFSEEVVKLLTTKEFYPAILVTPIYVYYYLFAIMGTLSMGQLTIAEKMKYQLPSAFVSVILNIILNLILIPRYGALGAATSASLTAFVSQIILLYYGMKVFPLPLGKFKLARLYVMLILYTIPIYSIILFDVNFFLKIIMKLCIICTFIILGIYFNFINKSDILDTIKLNKIINKRFF